MDGQQLLGGSQFSFNFTRLSKAIAAVLAFGYILQLLVPVARDYLTLVPGRSEHKPD